MKIRIATKGWAGGENAKTADEVVVGFSIPWIELDGHQFGDVTHVDFALDERDFNKTLVTIGLLGPVEVVYLDKNGNELKTEVRPADSLPEHLEYSTWIEPQGDSK